MNGFACMKVAQQMNGRLYPWGNFVWLNNAAYIRAVKNIKINGAKIIEH
jgi:hypothetical protein